MLKKKFIENSRFAKRKSDTPIGSECDNSFLVEVPHNSDIGENLRNRIEERYQQSIVNHRYKFPRGSFSRKSLSTQKKSLAVFRGPAEATPVRRPLIKVPSICLKKSASLLVKNKKSKTPANTRLKSLARVSFNKYTHLELSSTVSRSTASSQNPSISSYKSSKKTCLRKINRK